MFSLAASLTGHIGDARCCCVLADGLTIVTGGRDNTAKSWKLNAEGVYEQGFVIGDDAWITSCASVRSDSYALALGTHARSVKLYNSSGELQTSLGGHTGPVASLATFPPFESKKNATHLLSGSWDGCVRVWDLHLLSCVRIIPGSENSVCVLALNDGKLISGSSGVAQGNAIVDIHIRVWPKDAAGMPEREKPLFVVPPQDTPQGPVRCIAGLSDANSTRIVATSNDGSTRVFKVLPEGGKLECEQVMVNPSGLDTQGPALNLGACFLANTNLLSPEICVASDDMCARVWRDGVVEEEIEHPSTVWSTCSLPNGNLVTTGSDGVVRIFTRAAEAMETPLAVEFRQLASAARQAVRDKSKVSAIDPSSVPKIQDAGPGTKDGQYKMFNKNGAVFAYQWSASSASWLEIGEAVSSGGDKQELDGEMYDVVVPVEIDDQRGRADNNRTGSKLRIGFNRGDNPYLVASNFLKRNELPDEYLEQIVAFIKQQSGSGFSNGGGGAPSASSGMTSSFSSSVPPQTKKKRSFPLQDATGLSFEKGSPDKAIAKILEVASATNDASVLTFRQDLNDLNETLRNTSKYHASLVTPRQVDLLVRRLNAWPLKDRFAQFDLVRAVLMHPDSGTKFAGEVGMNFFAEACRVASAKDCPTPTRLTALRAASNMFRATGTAQSALRACRDASLDPTEKLASSLCGSDPSIDANSRIACATVIFNTSNALAHAPRSDRDSAVSAQCARAALGLLRSAGGRAEEENAVVVARALMILGNVATTAKHVLDQADWTNLKSSGLAKLSSTAASQIDKLVGEIDEVLASRD